MDNEKNRSEEYPDFSKVFDIDESSIPDKIIEKDPNGPKITNPVLTSEEAQRFLPKETKKALEKEKHAQKKQQKKNKRRIRTIMILSAAVLLFITAGIVNFIIRDAATPSVSVEKPVKETISRYFTETAVTVSRNDSVEAVFVDNDYDVHYIEKGQPVEITISEGTVIGGIVSEIKEEAPDSEFIKEYYTVLTGTAPSTSVYAVYIRPSSENAGLSKGTTLTAKVITKTASDVLTVPSSAVFINGNQHYVWLYNSFRKTLSRQDVSIGISVDGKTEIIKGIDKSDRIAVTFSCLQEQLYEGIRVKNR